MWMVCSQIAQLVETAGHIPLHQHADVNGQPSELFWHSSTQLSARVAWHHDQHSERNGLLCEYIVEYRNCQLPALCCSWSTASGVIRNKLDKRQNYFITIIITIAIDAYICSDNFLHEIYSTMDASNHGIYQLIQILQALTIAAFKFTENISHQY